MRKIPVQEITKRIDPIVELEQNWAVLSAGDADEMDAMTVAWGGMGNVWWKHTVTLYIRPQRATRAFMDKQGRYALTFFDDGKQAMQVLGTRSLKDDPDKIRESGLTPVQIDGVPAFAEGRYVLILKTLYRQQMTRESFLDPSFGDQNYPEDDWSWIYIAEIEAAYERN